MKAGSHHIEPSFPRKRGPSACRWPEQEPKHRATTPGPPLARGRRTGWSDLTKMCLKRFDEANVASRGVQLTLLEIFQKLPTRQHAADSQQDQEPMTD